MLPYTPTITQILDVINKPFLVKWKVENAQAITAKLAAEMYSDASFTDHIKFHQALTNKVTAITQQSQTDISSRGTSIHDLISYALLTKMKKTDGLVKPEPTDSTRIAWENWRTWANKVKPKPLYIEHRIQSDVHKYRGKLDAIIQLGKIVTVVDWKTGKAVYPEAIMQVAAYARAAAEMKLVKPGYECAVIRISKDDPRDEVEVVKVDKAEEVAAFGAFLSARQLWGYLNA